MNSFSVVKL